MGLNLPEVFTERRKRESMSRYKEHKKICNFLNEMYINKNKDYGNSFGDSISRYGYVAALTRISDKFFRIENLLLGRDPEVTDETVEDTLLDLANYAIMTVLEMRATKDEIDSEDIKMDGR